MPQANRCMKKINLESSGRMDGKAGKMNVGNKLGNKSLYQGGWQWEGAGELVTQRKLLEWLWIHRV